MTLASQRRRTAGIPHLAPGIVLSIALSGCAPARITLPSDAGAPFPDYSQVFTELTTACRGVRTLTAELSLSGRAGDQKLRGRVLAGFERPASMRLEGVAPFGAPAFILVARGQAATLLLPRERHVVRDAAAEEILGALTGVSLAPGDLQAILTGCVVAAPKAATGRLHANGWASVGLDGGATVYLKRVNGTWQIRAARRAPWRIEYPAWQGAFPAGVRLQSDMPAKVDLTATMAQVETNVDLDAAAFTVSVPADATPLSIEALRNSGPLQGD
jgi:outer membrane lipoprotein-sorting protein